MKDQSEEEELKGPEVTIRRSTRGRLLAKRSTKKRINERKMLPRAGVNQMLEVSTERIQDGRCSTSPLSSRKSGVG